MSANELRKFINKLNEAEFINNYSRTISADIDAYELSRLLQKFRAEKYTDDSIGQRAIIIPYTEQEEKEIRAFLRKEGVTLKDEGEKPKEKEETRSVIRGDTNR